MPIVKFCNRSHNPLLSDTSIQVCSLYYYKSTDDEFIRDVDEGVLSRTLHPLTPAVFTGDYIGKMTGLPISGTGTVRLAGKAVKTTSPLPDAYVFCTSRLERPTREHAASFGYDSWYVIKEATQLCNAMAREIARQLAPGSQILPFHGVVSYQGNKGVVYHALSDFVRSQRVIDPSTYFLKPKTSREGGLKVYADEREYRFVFLPVGEDGRPMRLTKDKIYLESSCVLDLIEKDAV